MNPKAKKRKPKGTKITLGGRNAAERFTSKNKPVGDNKPSKATRINTRRADRAMRKGNTEEVTTRKMVSPASSKIVKPAGSKTVSSTTYVPNEVRAGDYAGQKERKDNTKPVAKKDGTKGQRIQFGVQEARKNKQEIAMVDGKPYAAGKNVTVSKVMATPEQRIDTPAMYKTETVKVPKFKKYAPKPKDKKKKGSSTRRTTNARTQRVTVTGTKK